MAYKVRTKGSFDSGGVKLPLRRVLSVIGQSDTFDATRAKKKTPIGHQ